MTDGQDPNPPKPILPERERRDRVLLELIASRIPREFWIGIRSGIISAYRETHDANLNDPRLLQQSHGFKTINDRHFYCDKVLYDVALEFGFHCVPEQVRINRWRYAQAAFGSFTAIQKYCRTENDLPKAAEFRKKLARSGGISIQDDLLRPHLAKVGETTAYNGMLIHGPLSRAFRSPDLRDVGFICFAIPYVDYSEWAAVFSIDRLIAECQSQGKGSGLSGSSDENSVAPLWKKRPDQEG